MSLFASQLQVALENAEMTRVELAESCGIPYRTLSNYATDVRLPDKDTLRLICSKIPEEERAALIVARAGDEVPSEFRHLVTIEERSPSLREEQAPYIRPARALPAQVARAIQRLAEAAGENEEWKRAVLALADLLDPSERITAEEQAAHFKDSVSESLRDSEEE